MNLKNQTGRSMIEMLGVLAIIGVLSVGGLAGYSKAMIKFKTNKTIDEIIAIANNIKTLYANQKTYDDFYSYSCNELESLGIVPVNMCDPEGNIKNAFNGDVRIQGAFSDGNHPDIFDAYSIYIMGIPKEACMELAIIDWQNFFESIEVGSSLWGPGTVLGISDCLGYGQPPDLTKKGYTWACKNYNQIPISPSDAALACDCSATDNLCEFVFTGR